MADWKAEQDRKAAADTAAQRKEGLWGGSYDQGGRLTASDRRAMPAREFALPGHGAGPKGRGAGAYPIDTAGRARSALSRGAANASPGEFAEIRRKVSKKYPHMQVKGEC